MEVVTKGRMVQKTAHLLAETATVLLRDPLGHRHGGDPPGLRAADLPPGCVAGLSQVLSDLRGLSGARLSHHDQDLIVVDSLSGDTTTLLVSGRKRKHGADVSGRVHTCRGS